MNQNKLLMREAGIPCRNTAFAATTCIVGAAAGAAAGAIAGPLGIAMGVAIGIFAGILTGQTMAHSDTLREQYVARLDREIGVFG